jgi:acyl-coenzyme A thioesterase PaaI-like protein
MKFAEATAVTPAGEGTWKAEVQPDWDIFGITDGGYLMAIAARAMSGSTEGRMPVSLSAHFLRPIQAGPVEVNVEVLKRGRTFSTLRATVSAASDSISLLGSFADPDAIGSGPALYAASAPPALSGRSSAAAADGPVRRAHPPR